MTFKVKTTQYDPLDPSDHFSNHYYTMAIESSDELFHCMVHLPDQAGTLFQLNFGTIAEAQIWDIDLTALKANNPSKFTDESLTANTKICCYSAQPGDLLRIYLPQKMLENSVRWYYLALSHVGSNRLFNTMSMHFYNKKMKPTIERIVTTCDATVNRGRGELAPREAALILWQEVMVDLIGPWTLSVAGQELKFSALTIIDTVTNLIELVRIQAWNP